MVFYARRRAAGHWFKSHPVLHYFFILIEDFLHKLIECKGPFWQKTGLSHWEWPCHVGARMDMTGYNGKHRILTRRQVRWPEIHILQVYAPNWPSHASFITSGVFTSYKPTHATYSQTMEPHEDPTNKPNTESSMKTQRFTKTSEKSNDRVKRHTRADVCHLDNSIMEALAPPHCRHPSCKV